MPREHKVKQGETLPKIAKEHGFSNWHTVYEHPDNAELRERRPNPNILYPGDRVAIPEKTTKEEAGETEQRSRFLFKGEQLWLRIVVTDVDYRPLANRAYKLEVRNLNLEGTTDTEGLLEQKIPENAEEGILHIDNWALPLKIGHLDPIEEVTGWQARLKNLGYYSGPVDGQVQDDNGKDRMQLKAAIEEFQLDHGLKVDGIVGSKTEAKIKEAHGC